MLVGCSAASCGNYFTPRDSVLLSTCKKGYRTSSGEGFKGEWKETVSACYILALDTADEYFAPVQPFGAMESYTF